MYRYWLDMVYALVRFVSKNGLFTRRLHVVEVTDGSTYLYLMMTLLQMIYLYTLRNYVKFYTL